MPLKDVLTTLSSQLVARDWVFVWKCRQLCQRLPKTFLYFNEALKPIFNQYLVFLLIKLSKENSYLFWGSLTRKIFSTSTDWILAETTIQFSNSKPKIFHWICAGCEYRLDFEVMQVLQSMHEKGVLKSSSEGNCHYLSQIRARDNLQFEMRYKQYNGIHHFRGNWQINFRKELGQKWPWHFVKHLLGLHDFTFFASRLVGTK